MYNGLEDVYYGELKKLRGGKIRSYEEYMEELAIAHITSLIKLFIGAKSLDVHDQNCVEVMQLSLERCRIAMYKHDTLGTFQKYKKGKLLSMTQ